MLRGVATNGPAPPQVEESRLRYRFIVPDLRGPSTGGTVYNARLLAALCEMKLDVRRVEGDEIRAALTDPLPCHLWVDSLCLDILPCCRETGVRRHAVGLLTHYLPSLVKRGAPLQRSQLGLAERFAIDAADAFLVTSEFMRITVMNLLTRIRPVFVVEPGQFAQGRAADAPFATRVSAIMVANLLPGKGVNRFLRELARQVHEDDNFTIRIVGSMTLDADCARACERIVRAHPILSKSIEFAGPRSPSEVVEDIATSYLFVSASMMESYRDGHRRSQDARRAHLGRRRRQRRTARRCKIGWRARTHAFRACTKISGTLPKLVDASSSHRGCTRASSFAAQLGTSRPGLRSSSAGVGSATGDPSPIERPKE